MPSAISIKSTRPRQKTRPKRKNTFDLHAQRETIKTGVSPDSYDSRGWSVNEEIRKAKNEEKAMALALESSKEIMDAKLEFATTKEKQQEILALDTVLKEIPSSVELPKNPEMLPTGNLFQSSTQPSGEERSPLLHIAVREPDEEPKRTPPSRAKRPSQYKNLGPAPKDGGVLRNRTISTEMSLAISPTLSSLESILGI